MARKGARRGPKTKYREDFPDMVREWRAKGLTPKQIARNLGISYSTFWIYLRRHPEMRQAYDDGRIDATREAESALFKLVTGFYVEEDTVERSNTTRGDTIRERTSQKYYPPNLGAIIFYLTNEAPEQWRNTQAHHHTTEDNFKVELTVKEVEERLKQVPTDKLKILQKAFQSIGKHATLENVEGTPQNNGDRDNGKSN